MSSTHIFSSLSTEQQAFPYCSLPSYFRTDIPSSRYRYMGEIVLTILGQKHYLWQAVDQDGIVLDILVQSRRNKKAAKRFFRKLLNDYNTCLM